MTWSPGGKPSRILGVYNNIHEARKNGESLKELENRYRLVTENTSEGVWIIDENGYTTYVNPAMCEILGYKPNEMIGKTLGSYISKNSAQEYSAHISNIRQGIREHKELALTGRDGRIVYASFETAPLIDEQGTYMGALSVISDETPRNEMEKKIKEYEGGYEEAKRMYGLLADGINGGAVCGRVKRNHFRDHFRYCKKFRPGRERPCRYPPAGLCPPGRPPGILCWIRQSSCRIA